MRTTEPSLPIVRPGEPIDARGLQPGSATFTPDHAWPNWPYLNPAPVTWRGAALVLPVPGCYFLRDDTRTQAFLAASRDAVAAAAMGFSFAAGACGGGTSDVGSFVADSAGFVARLFERAAPVGLNCGPTSWVLARILAALGLRTRSVDWIGSAAYPSHKSLEVLIPGAGWTLYDAHCGIAYRPGVGGLHVFSKVHLGRHDTADFQMFLPKYRWAEEPWTYYQRYGAAFGIISADPADRCVTMVVAEGREHVEQQLAVRRRLGKVRLVSPAELQREFYVDRA